MKNAFTRNIILFFVSILPRLVIGPLFIDDAYIYFRYVENAVSGAGLVFNNGEYVFGTTSVFYTLILFLVSLLTYSAPLSSILINTVSQYVTTVWVFYITRKYLDNKYSWFAVMLYNFNPVILTNSLSGMETSLFLALIMSAVGFYIEKKYLLSSIFTGILAITRPEGLIFLIVYVILTLMRKTTTKFDWLFLFFPILGVSLLLGVFYGSVLPNSVIAKSFVYPANKEPLHNFRIIMESFLDVLSVYRGNINPASWVIFFSLFVMGIVSLLKQNYDFLLLVVWVFLVGGVYSLTNRFLFRWYIVPFILFSTLIFPYAIFFLVRKMEALSLNSEVMRRFKKILSIICIFFLIVTQTFNNWSYINSTKFDISTREEKYQQIANLIKFRFGQKYTIASVEIGSLGYYYRGKIFDLAGLITPESINFYKAPGYTFEYPHKVPQDLLTHDFFDFLVAYDLFIGNFIEDPKFTEKYTMIYKDSYRHHYFGTLMVFIRTDLLTEIY